jgi:hypothetical protein
MITTPPLDPSLDVNHRLANLQTWQGEWRRIDHQLEEQVSRLDGTNLTSITASGPYLHCATTHGHDAGQTTSLHS